VRQAIAREVPGVREHESGQPAAAREEPGVQEQEQPADTVRQAIARDEPGMREHESLQRGIAREDPAVRARESRQRAVARGKETTTRARVIRPLFLPQGAQIEIEYNPHHPSISIQTIVRQVEALGYWVSVEPF